MGGLSIPDEGVYTVQLHKKELRGLDVARDAPEVARVVRGVIAYEDGSRYEGELRNGERHGVGKLSKGAPSWDEYEGHWEHDVRHGHGVYRKGPGGCSGSYDGEWRHDRMHGRGEERFAAATPPPAQGQEPAPHAVMYSGEYVDGKMHGVGSLTWHLQPPEEDARREEHIYRGHFAADLRSGVGCMYMLVDTIDGLRSAQNVYVGMWEDGKRHGPGKLVYSKRQLELPRYPKDTMYVDYHFEQEEGKGGGELKLPDPALSTQAARLNDLATDMKDMKYTDAELMDVADAILQPA